jgi:hypothetical protein
MNNTEGLNKKFVENRLVHTWEESESLISDEVYDLCYNYTYGKVILGAVVKIKGKYKPMMHIHNKLKHNCGYIRDSKGSVHDINFDTVEDAKLFVEGQLIEINSSTV